VTDTPELRRCGECKHLGRLRHPERNNELYSCNPRVVAWNLFQVVLPKHGSRTSDFFRYAGDSACDLFEEKA